MEMFTSGAAPWCSAQRSKIQGSGFDPELRLCSLRIRIGFLHSPSTSQKNIGRNSVYAKLPLCVKEHPIQSRVCSWLVPSVPGIGTECTTTLTRTKCLLKMKEWMNIYFNYMHTGWVAYHTHVGILRIFFLLQNSSYDTLSSAGFINLIQATRSFQSRQIEAASDSTSIFILANYLYSRKYYVQALFGWNENQQPQWYI